MKKIDDDKMWAEIFAAERSNERRLVKAMEQSSKRGSFLSIFDDRLIIDTPNGGQWTVIRETGVANWQSPAVRHPAKQENLFE